MRYKSIADYIKKNTKMHGDYSMSVTDVSEKEDEMLLVTIRPTDADGDTADFLVHADGAEEYTTEL